MKHPSLLIIDNQDSFTFNLAEGFRRMGATHLKILSEKEVTLSAVESADRILLSPGPGLPEEHPACFDILSRFAGRKSFLGVCLGHQMIGLFYGASLEHLEQPSHGRCARAVKTRDDVLLADLPPLFEVGLYHSWRLSENHWPGDLEVTAREQEGGGILAIRHCRHASWGVQFHPESVLTPQGQTLMKTFWLKG